MRFRRLRELRRERNLTQREVAKVLGISQQVYSCYERGAQTIPLRHLASLAEFYSVSVDYLLERTGNPAPYPWPGGAG